LFAHDGSGPPLHVITFNSSANLHHTHTQAWGHSTITGPWGNVIATCDRGDALVVGEVNMNWVADVRRRIALRAQKRADMYAVVDKTRSDL
jgi:omega-amidase